MTLYAKIRVVYKYAINLGIMFTLRYFANDFHCNTLVIYEKRDYHHFRKGGVPSMDANVSISPVPSQ